MILNRFHFDTDSTVHTKMIRLRFDPLSRAFHKSIYGFDENGQRVNVSVDGRPKHMIESMRIQTKTY